MNKGDKLEVFVGGVVVGYAEVETIGDETITVLIPAQRFVGKKKVNIDLTPEPVEGASTVVLTDGVTTPASGGVQSASEAVESPVSPANNSGVSVPAQTPQSAVEAPTESPVTPVAATEPVAVTAEDVKEVNEA